MAFVIGWSSVVAAQQNFIHQQMMNEMTIRTSYFLQIPRQIQYRVKQQVAISAHILPDRHQPLWQTKCYTFASFQTAELEHTTTQCSHLRLK